MATSEANLQECISKVCALEVLHQDVVQEICKHFIRVCMREQNVVPIDGPVTIVGCLNGQLHDLLNIFDMAGNIPYTNYLFLGDYVNFGMYGLELYIVLMCFKILHPTKVVMLRGMNEIKAFSDIGGFHSECFNKYGNEVVYKMILETFNYLPIAADVQGKYFCSHGGVLPDVSTNNLQVLSRVKNLKKEDTLTWWIIAQPKEEKYSKYFRWFERSDPYTFTEADVETFIQRNPSKNGQKFKMIINTNSLQPLGQAISDNQRVTTIWSAADFLGEFNNQGCYIDISSSGKLSSIQFCAPPRSVLPVNWKPLHEALPKGVPDFLA